VPGTGLQLGDHVVVEAGQVIPGDGDVVEGVASVDESAITGESAPVIRESGGEGELAGAEFVEFTAQTRMSGVDLADGRQVRKGAASSVAQWIRDSGGHVPGDLGSMVDPAVMTGAGQLAFHNQANGSTISYHGHTVGSSLLCQAPRCAATKPRVATSHARLRCASG
jgi:high-affinity K+ transport system ATPase subunit B